MSEAKVILDQSIDISERYRVELKVFEIDASKRYPEGVKVRFILLDLVKNCARLLIDNHSPFGFHVHMELPKNKQARMGLNTRDYRDAMNEFWRLVEEIVKNEN